MGLAMLLATRSYPEQQAGGMRTWAWACGIQCLAWLMLAVRELLPEFVSIILGNTVFVIAGVFYYWAVAQFRERKVRVWVLLVPVLVTFFGLIPFTYLSPNIAVRLVIVSICLAALLFASGVTLLQGPSRKPLSYWLTGICFVTIGVGVIFRAIYLLATDPTQAGRAAEDPVQSLIFAANYVEVILMTFGFVLMRIDRSNADLLRLATFDSLTNCLNRAAVERQLALEIARARRENGELVLLMVDIDHFKTINDSLGHAEGDAAIRTVAGCLKTHVRSSDIIGRFGGDEFVVLLPNVSPTQARITADRMCSSVARSQFNSDQERGTLTVSIGIAHLLKFEQEDSLLRRADDALYRAKANGRNCVEAEFTPFENSQVVPST